MTKYHCNGDANDPLIQFEYNEIKETIRMDNEAKNSTSWKSLFTEKANLRRMRIIIAIAFFSQWVGNGLISYYLTLLLKGVGITSEGDQTLINGILQIWNYAWAIGGALVVDRVGRRFLFLASMTGMLVSFVAWTICSATYAKSSVFDPACIAENKGKSNNCVAIKANKGAGYAVIVFIFTFFASYSIALTPLLISYTVEILPVSGSAFVIAAADSAVPHPLQGSHGPVAHDLGGACLQPVCQPYRPRCPRLEVLHCLLLLPWIRLGLLLPLCHRDARPQWTPAP